MTYQVMPSLSPEDYEQLKADIAERGVLVPVELDEAGNVLDGHHRIKAAQELGLEKWPQIVRIGMSEDEKRTHARKLNMARRHLSREQKRELIATAARENPTKTDREIADDLGVSHVTVADVRHSSNELCNGQNDQCTRITRDGRVFPAKREPAHQPSPTEPPASIAPTAEYEAVAAKLSPEAIEGLTIQRPGWVAPQREDEQPDEKGERQASEPLVNRTNFTGNNQWFTPQEHIDLARRVLGEIDLDPATHPIAQERVQAKAFFTEEDDGLGREWHGRVWLNPPYAQPAIEQFVDKMIAEHGAGRVSQAVMLTHNYTDTGWFHKAARACSAICFTRGRVRFVSPSGDLASPTQGQAFFYFGNRPEEFAREFSDCGFLVEVRNVSGR